MFGNPRRAVVVWVGGALFVAAVAGPACIRRGPPPPVSSWATALSPPPADEPGAPAFVAAVTFDRSQRHQTLEGFGASVAWHQDKLVPAGPEGIYDLLFPKLGIDILRLRNRHGRITKKHDGNITQDVEIYRKGSAALGRPLKVLMSSWTPPASIKASHEEDCHSNPDCTLVKEGGKYVYEKFGEYWRESLAHYASQGIVPEWISIQNEPQANWIPPFWEGCAFDATETERAPGYDRALVAVHAAVQKLPRPPKLIGPEVLGIHWGTIQKFVAAMDMNLVYGLAHHIYEKGPDNVWDWKDPGPDSFIDEMRAVPALTRKPIFQTEFHTDEDGGYQGGLGGFETAWLMHHSLVEEGVAAFLYWDLIWTTGGLVAMEARPPRIRDQYYSMRHYARFTDPGDVRIGAASDSAKILVSAFVSPGGDRLTVIVLNTAAEPAEVRIEAGALRPAKTAVYRTVYRPKASQTWKELGPLVVGQGVAMPGRSVVTVVMDGLDGKPDIK